MSSSIKIPNSRGYRNPSIPSTPPTTSSSYVGSPPSTSYGATKNADSMPAPSPSSALPGNGKLDKGKGKQIESPLRTEEEERARWASSPFKRRQSLMGKELEKTKHIVVDIGPPDAPRLVACLSSSQGFEWNSSLFLPRYMNGRGSDEALQHRQDPIEDVIVTDEEVKNLFPQW